MQTAARILPLLIAGLLSAAAPGASASETDALAAEEAAAQEAKNTIYPALTGGVLYDLLVSEAALQQKNPELAYDLLIDAARESKNPEPAETAYRLSARMGDFARADAALGLWTELASPDERTFPEALANVRRGNFDAAKSVLRARLEQSEKPSREFELIFASMNGQKLYRVLPFIAELGDPYAETEPVVALSLLQTAAQSNDAEKALRYARAAIKSNPESGQIIRTAANGLFRADRAAALEILKERTEAKPEDLTTAFFYVKALLTARKSEEASAEMKRIGALPLAGKQWLMLGELQDTALERTAAAESYMKYLDETGGKKQPEAGKVHLRLGMIEDAAGRPDAALIWYAKVPEGPAYATAKTLTAGIHMRKGDAKRAMETLEKAKPESVTGREEVARMLSQIRAEQQDARGAYSAMLDALESGKNTPRFIYDTAMRAEEAREYEDAEFYLRKFIALEPESAAGYNALGYTLADRNTRLTEALSLLRKAERIDPNDNCVLDSLGWVYFRMGDREKALKYLNRALSVRYDSESVDHAVQVYLSKGQKQKASEFLTDWMIRYPKDEALAKIKTKYGL